MIKGKYVGTVEIDFHISVASGIDEAENSRVLDNVKRAMMDGSFTAAMQERLKQDFMDDADVIITQQYADIYEV
jgi:hypothetical protein